MIFFTPQSSPRIQYMAQWLGMRLFGRPLQVINDLTDLVAGEPVFNYSVLSIGLANYQVVPHGLLAETGIQPQAVDVKGLSSMPIFFSSNQGDHAFDFLSASFYLVSRYEEYLPFEKDEYGRYSHTNSVAWKNDFLKRPIVDEWVEDLKKRLMQKFPGLQFSKNECRYIPTYDVDIAWSYRNKSLWRNLAGWFNDVRHLRFAQLVQRWAVWLGGQPDPFDIFKHLQQAHRHHQLHPIYFFLLAAEYKGYDRNINIRNRNLHLLMQQLKRHSEVGIHFSWAAADNMEKMKAEKQFMQNVIGSGISSNRMHYLNFHLPATFQQLLDAGITDDYSMGYGTVNGFRAGTNHAYYWYDLTKEASTPLQIHPFAWMDANSIFEQHDTPAQALAELTMMYQAVQKTGGHFITICHNHLMGLDAVGRKWWKVYNQFLSIVDSTAATC